MPLSSLKNKILVSKNYEKIFLLIIILFIIIVRINTLSLPLEHDEGEYAYMGQLILEKIPPYKLAYNMKFPGTYIMYAIIMRLFGESTAGIHVGLLFVNIINILLVYKLTKILANKFCAPYAAAIYGILTLGPEMIGSTAHATHFVTIFALSGIIILLTAINKNKLPLFFLSGIFLGLSVIMKQSGIFFPLFGIAIIISNYLFDIDKNKKNLFFKTLYFVLGILAPIIFLFLLMYWLGVFDKFWFWTFNYLQKYSSIIFGLTYLEIILYIFHEFNFVIGNLLIWWFFALIGGIFLIKSDKFMRITKINILFFLLFSLLTVIPGFYFRPHYFVTFAPALSILIAIFFFFIYNKIIHFYKKSCAEKIIMALFISFLIPYIILNYQYFFTEDTNQLSKNFYVNNAFSESIAIADFINSHSDPADKIAVFGSEPQIYFYAQRQSATGYIYTYGLMEEQDYALNMQKEMISEIETSKPKFIISIYIANSWNISPNSNLYIFDWFNKYTNENYQLAGIVDLFNNKNTVYKWYNEINNYQLKPYNYILIFEKKGLIINYL